MPQSADNRLYKLMCGLGNMARSFTSMHSPSTLGRRAKSQHLDVDQIGGHKRFVGTNSWPSPCHSNSVVGTMDRADNSKPAVSSQFFGTKGEGWPFPALS